MDNAANQTTAVCPDIEITRFVFACRVRFLTKDPGSKKKPETHKDFRFLGNTGIEPVTPTMSRLYSNQLS